MSEQYNPIKLFYFNRATERLEAFRKLDPSTPEVKETFEEDADRLASISKTRAADLEDSSKFVTLQSEDGKQSKKVTIEELYFIVGSILTQETLEKRKDPEKVKELGQLIDILYIESCEFLHEGLHRFYPDEFQPVDEDEEDEEEIGEELLGEESENSEDLSSEATSDKPTTTAPPTTA